MQPPEPPPDSIFLVILVILLLCSMFFSASETAFISSNKLRIKYLKEKKNKAAARVERILHKKEFFLNAILVGNNIVNIASSALITALSIEYFGDAGVGIATAIATIIILVFGEILPKSVALLRPENVALRVSLPLSIFLLITAPFISVFLFFTRGITVLLGVKNKKERPSVTEEDIKNMIEAGEEEGLIESKKSDMMHKILKYTDLTARDIMTPRTDMISISLDTSRKDIFALSLTSRYSRFPVYGNDIDDIRGILYIKDFLFAEDLNEETFSVKHLLRPALFIFENQKMSALQEKLRSSNQNIAVIVDEYGGTAGIVTTENLIESIFGGLNDEYDRPASEQKEHTGDQLDTTSWILDGAERLDDINERFSIQLNSEFYDTVAGYLMERSGEMPEAGVSITEQGYIFTISAVAGNRIEQVHMNRIGGPL